MTKLLEQLAEQLPAALLGKHRCLVAVSGGADSTALLRGMTELAGQRDGSLDRIIVAHYHHGLRPSADRDLDFVRTLAADLGLPLVAERASSDALAQPPTDGWEARARQLRYAFLERAAAEAHARYVLTAHTADDQAETVLFRALRGTGWRGLAGIPTVSAWKPGLTLLRPLLGTTRAEVREYLAALDQPFCRDETNDQPLFTRNRLRSEVFPLLDEVMGRDTRSQLVKLADQLSRWQEWLEPEIQRQLKACVSELGPARLVVALEPLDRLPVILRAEVLRAAWQSVGWPEQAMTDSHWSGLANAGTSPQGARTATWQLPAGVEVSRGDGQLLLTRTVG